MQHAIRIVLAIAMNLAGASCSATYQQDGQAKQVAMNFFGKQKFSKMTGPAGTIEGYETDNEMAAKMIGSVVITDIVTAGVVKSAQIGAGLAKSLSGDKTKVQLGAQSVEKLKTTEATKVSTFTPEPAATPPP